MFHEIHERILDNGLTVLAVPNSTSPTATSQVWYRVGSRNERTGITGISHIFEHMMFKGTARHPKGAFDRIVQENGMSYNAFTSSDYTAYYEVMAADRLEIALDLEADRMQGLNLDPQEFASEMAVIREERRQTREDPPFGLLAEAVQAAMFTVHPYRWPVIGWMTDLHSITLDDVRAYYADFYRPNNATLVVVGDVAADRVFQLAESYFGGIAAGPALPEVRGTEPEPRGERTVSVHKEVQLPGLILGYPAPRYSERDTKVLHVIEFLLFHGRSTRLYQKCVYQNQLATSLSGGIHFRRDPSDFVIHGMARPGVPIETLRDAIYEELVRLGEEEVRETELAKALRSIESDFVFSQESNHELGQQLGRHECLGSWRDFSCFLEDHRGITAADVQRVARATFAERKRTVGYLVPETASGRSQAWGDADADADVATDPGVDMDPDVAPDAAPDVDPDALGSGGGAA